MTDVREILAAGWAEMKRRGITPEQRQCIRAMQNDGAFFTSCLAPSVWRREGCVCDPRHVEVGGYDAHCEVHGTAVSA